MPTKQQQDFEIWTGNYHELRFTVAGLSPANEVSAAEWSIEFGNGSILTKTMADQSDPITVEDIAQTDDILVTVIIGEAVTVGKAGLGRHELVLTNSDDHPATVAVGTALINPSIPPAV